MKKRIWILLGAVAVLICVAIALPNFFNGEVELVFDDYRKMTAYDRNVEFRMDEYPDVLFRCNTGMLTAEENGIERTILSGMPILNLYLADLSGDGRRELCATTSFGSGMVDERILVYDYTDSMLYQLQERGAYNYFLSISNSRLIVHKTAYRDDTLVAKGTLTLDQRKLSFVSEGAAISGERASPQINAEILEQMFRRKKEQIASFPSSGQYGSTQIPRTDALDYYLSTRKDILMHALYDGGSFYNVEHLQVKSNLDDFQYMMVLADLAGHYDGYTVYYANKPEQLFICTEVRDTGYDTIEAYYQALSAGNAHAHVDTFVIRLDTHALYRWGEEENLYNSYVL